MTPDSSRNTGGSWTININENPPVSGSEASDAGFAGTLQQLLQQNAGYYVTCEFFFGSRDFVRREGYLYMVGGDFLVLRDMAENRYTICDFYSLRFVTFYEPGREPQRPFAAPNAAQRPSRR
jgi:hypothetical protein